jgi:hypothetical protein
VVRAGPYQSSFLKQPVFSINLRKITATFVASIAYWSLIHVSRNAVHKIKESSMKMETFYLSDVTRRMAAIIVVAAGIALLTGALSAQAQDGKKDKAASKSIGFNMSATATEKDLGLPFYPGAKPYKEDADSDPALHMAMSGGSFGFKLVVMKLESADSPEKIAAFYRKAMAKYGTVLDCSKAAPDSGKKDSEKNNEKSNTLTCEDDHADKGGYAYKVGTKQKQHVVAVEPNGKSTIISMVYVESPDDKDNGKDNDKDKDEDKDKD